MNIEHQTPNTVTAFGHLVRCSAFDVGCSNVPRLKPWRGTMKPRSFPPTRPALFAAAVKRAAELLRAGEVVALPTETVYGLAANALNKRPSPKFSKSKTVRRIIDYCPYRGRRNGKTLRHGVAGSGGKLARAFLARSTDTRAAVREGNSRRCHGGWYNGRRALAEPSAYSAVIRECRFPWLRPARIYPAGFHRRTPDTCASSSATKFS